MYVTPFNKTMEPKVFVQTGKTNKYHLKLQERDLYITKNFDKSKIENYMCENTNSKITFKSTLILPQHLTTIMGQQY